MRKRVTITIEETLLDDIEHFRTKKTDFPRIIDDRSHFVEKLLIIGLHAYKDKQSFFEQININNIDLSQIKF